MNDSHVISDEVLDLVNTALSKGKNWMAYNHSLYFIDKEDVQFFKDKDEAIEFAANNISDKDRFHVIHFNSILDIYKKISYSTKMEMQLINNPDANGLHNHEGNAFTDALIDHAEEQLLNTKKTNVMNKENLQYLSDNIKYMGFGENLKAELEKNMNEGKGEFQLQYKVEINKKPFEATLNFRKSESTDMYFFNRYQASIVKANDEKLEQNFNVNKGKGITSKEAFNLLEGRAVHKDLVNKEGKPYKAWVQLDFDKKTTSNNFEVKQFHENYGFDLKAVVEKLAIVELKDPEKEKSLMQSLQKGNIQSVTIEKDSNSHKMFIEADPQYKKVNLYDVNMKLVSKESMEKYLFTGQNGAKEIKEEQEIDKKKDLKQDIKSDKPGKKNENSLLPKKRERNKNRLGVS